jgi:hypothetical protein
MSYISSGALLWILANTSQIVCTTELVRILWFVLQANAHNCHGSPNSYTNSYLPGTLAIKHVCIQSRDNVDTLVSKACQRSRTLVTDDTTASHQSYHPPGETSSGGCFGTVR